MTIRRGSLYRESGQTHCRLILKNGDIWPNGLVPAGAEDPQPDLVLMALEVKCQATFKCAIVFFFENTESWKVRGWAVFRAESRKVETVMTSESLVSDDLKPVEWDN